MEEQEITATGASTAPSGSGGTTTTAGQSHMEQAAVPVQQTATAATEATDSTSNNNNNNDNIPTNNATNNATQTSQHAPTVVVRIPPPPPPHPLARQASSDDDSLADQAEALVHPTERFEDEPSSEENFLPKPSPNRRKARLQRRKSAPKRKLPPDPMTNNNNNNNKNNNNNAISPHRGKKGTVVGLPKLRMFKPVTAPPPTPDDAASHWSSSDDETSHTRWLSPDDIEICQRLDEEYERALEEREVVYTARYNSVRQSACFSILFMLLYLSLGTMFFMRQTDWTVSESVLFSIYTITTVGCKCFVLRTA